MVFDGANSQLKKNPVFQHSPHISCAFLSLMNESLHTALIKICTGGGDPLSDHSSTHCAYVHCLVSKNI